MDDLIIHQSRHTIVAKLRKDDLPQLDSDDPGVDDLMLIVDGEVQGPWTCAPQRARVAIDLDLNRANEPTRDFSAQHNGHLINLIGYALGSVAFYYTQKVVSQAIRRFFNLATK